MPSLALFIYTAALGSSRGRTLAVGLYLAALIGFVLVSETGKRASTMPWVTSRAGRGMTPLLRGGATLGTVAVVAALVVGPNLPGAGSPGAINLHHLSEPGPSQRTTISPLVDIRALGGSAPDAGRVMAAGHDFFSSPRLSPDGRKLAYLAWDHPNMPWVGTTLYLVDLTDDGAPAGDDA